MINEHGTSEAKGISSQFLWRIVTFMAGALLALGVAWGTRSSQLEEVRSQMNKMSSQIEGFMDSYRVNDKATALKLNDVERHLENTDKNVDELRQQIEEIRKR